MGLLQQIMGLGGLGQGGGQGQTQVDPAQVDPQTGSQVLHSALGGTGFGGVTGLLEHLAASGMGGQVRSWLNPAAPNQPVDPNQIKQAIGGGELENIAGRLGVSPESALQFLSHHLPNAAAQARGPTQH
jgi:uncharacterized protein YidB (DUF937 family)